MKVLSAGYGGTYGPVLEDEILHCLRSGEHRGKKFTSQLVDRFGARGPNGNHIYLVFAAMGETLRGFAKRLRPRSEQGVSAKFVKKTVKQL